MTIGCFIDVDLDGSTEFYKERVRPAKKEHKCGECGDVIAKGQQYENVTLMCEGSFFSYKTCLICREIRGKFFCSWYYTMIWQTLHEEFYKGEGIPLCQLDKLSSSAIEKLSDYITAWLELEDDEE